MLGATRITKRAWRNRGHLNRHGAGAARCALFRVGGPARRAGLAALALLLSLAWAVPARAGEPNLRPDSKGRLAPVVAPVPETLRNPPLPAELEEGFQDRLNHVYRETVKARLGGVNTYFENEKRAYGFLMMRALGGDEKALKDLQSEDAQAKEWHALTAGIDWYACFTIKHQVRKYFYFGDLLDPAYRKRMYDGAKAWTQQDPLRRPHPAYKKAGEGWGPDVKNSWVDVRGTDNLWWMRSAGVYLMAEETGNESTRLIYKKAIRDCVVALYRIGMSEWDSENYLGHGYAPALSLYDFARDPEVKLLAKAAMDWMLASAAVKYWRGGFNGPTRRDYNHPYPMGGSAAAMSWLYFGEYPGEHKDFESDEVHAWTSGYRPPLAIVRLAQKRFDRPAELFAAKPPYGQTQQGKKDLEPADLETHYFGETFQLGTLAFGTGRQDVNGFKIIAWNSAKGMDYIVPAPTDNPRIVGSPQYGPGMVEPNRVAQYRNLAIWLAARGDSPWRVVLPKSIAVEPEGGVTFLRAEKTWVALHPVNLDIAGVSGEETAKVTHTLERDGKQRPHWPDHQVIAATGKGGTYCGFAVEVGEETTHGDYPAFKKRVLADAKLDQAQAREGIVEYVGAAGGRVKMKFAEALQDYQVWRNGELHDWNAHRVLYRQVGAKDGAGFIAQPWRGDGTLRVEAGGELFSCTVAEDGKVTFHSGRSGPP